VFTEAGLLSCALLPRNLQSQSNRAHFFWFLIALLLTTAPGPIDREDANPKQQCENVHKRREFAQIILPGLIGVTNQNDHAGDHTQGKTQPGQDPDNAHCPSGHGSIRPAGTLIGVAIALPARGASTAMQQTLAIQQRTTPVNV